MKSRFSAYALKLPDYIIYTTHSSNPQYKIDKAVWTQEILEFCAKTEFIDLEIIQTEDKGNQATVTFKAILKQGPLNASFTEKSKFEKLSGLWQYRKSIWLKPLE